MSNRTSSNLPPEELALTGRCSIWRGFKIAIGATLRALFVLPIDALERASSRVHQLLADSRRRKRKRQVCAFLGALS
jgi:hypothetical protein